MSIINADVVVGLAWGDEGKGKITSYLAKNNKYNYVCRWAGGPNAGHTVYIDGKKYKTHLNCTVVFLLLLVFIIIASSSLEEELST